MRLATDDQDPQREMVYLAEEEWLGDEDETRFPTFSPTDAASLSEVAASIIDLAGWECEHPPIFVLDVEDDSEMSAWHEADTSVIHMHPRLLGWDPLLHELSHWIDSRDGHGPRFCANHVSLVRATLGQYVAQRLIQAYQRVEVDIDFCYLKVNDPAFIVPSRGGDVLTTCSQTASDTKEAASGDSRNHL